MCLGSLDLRNVRKIRSVLDGCISNLINNHREILCKDPSKDFTRSCFFSAEKVLNTLLRFGAKNSESELIELLNCENTARNINASFLMQRRKLTEQCLPFLFQSFTEAVMADASLGLTKCLVRGRHLLACDGSDVNIAYNPSDPLTHIKKEGQRGYNQIHLNALYDVCTGCYMSASIQGIHKKQERRALVEMIGSLKDAKKCIVTADRGYESFNVFAAMVESGAEYVIRLKDIDSNGILSAYDLKDDEFDLKLSTRLTKRRTKETLGDIDTYTVLPYYTDFDFFDEDMMYDIEFRIVRFRIPNGSFVCVATNLPDDFTVDDLRKIYHLRWTCETAFRKLKFTVGLVNFHSRKMEYILQELYARLTTYNFTAFIVKVLEFENFSDPLDTDESATESSDENEKKIGIAFSQAVTACRQLLVKRPLKFIKDAIKIIKGHTFAIRLNREFERKVKPQSNRPFGYKTS